MKNTSWRQEPPRELQRQSEAQCMLPLKARQMCVDTNAISKNLAY